jgi:hypothetical protein
MVTMVALDPTGQELIMGGDVEGLWRTADFGDHWQLTQDSLYGPNWRSIACVAWSLLEPGTVYACAGEDAAGKPPTGGFLVSTDGGITWSLRSTQVQFQGNDAGSPPRPKGEASDADRSTGDLLAQDPGGGYLYAATYNGGIYRSSASYGSPVGSTWEPAGLSGGNYFTRALAINPSNTSELWAGVWEYTDPGTKVTYSGIYHCADAQSASSNADWTATSAPAGTVSDLKVIGGYLYAAYPTLGIYRHQIGGSGWTSLNGGAADVGNGQLWTSIDGYVDSAGNHQIVAASSSGKNLAKNATNYTNVVQITITPAGIISSADLTGTADINIEYLPPDNQTWWHSSGSFHYWLGGAAFVNPHVLIDPNDPSRIYVAGAGGFYRTDNANAPFGQPPAQVQWTIAMTGMPMSEAFLITVDPQDPQHVILSSADYTQTDLTDPTGWDTSKVTSVHMPSAGTECHALAFGPGSSVFTGVNTKSGKNAGGAVYWRAAGDFTTWHDTGYSAHVPHGYAPMGIFAGVDGNDTYIVVVSQGADVWRAYTADLTGNSWTWTKLSTGIGKKGNVGQQCPIVADNAPQFLYCFDRAQGVYRSDNYGQAGSWTRIWNTAGAGVTVDDTRSGWLAVNPAKAGELWVSASTGLYRLSGARTGTVENKKIQVTQMSSTYFPNGAAGIAFTAAGQPYVPALSGPLPESGPLVSPRLLTSADGGTSWTDAGGSSVGSYASWPSCVALAANPAGESIVLVASDSDWGIYGIPVS